MTERNVTPTSPARSQIRSPIPLNTPLVWAWGGVLLTATTWLTGMIALFRGVGSLF